MSDVLTREDVIRETDYMQSFDADHLGLLGASNLLRNHDAALRARVVELEEEVGRLKAERDEIIGNGEGMNDGPHANCTDCGRRMVWQRPARDFGDTFHHPGSWMCPNCVMERKERLAKERDEAQKNACVESACPSCTDLIAERDAALARATAAEAREVGLKAALNMMDECCWQAWKAFTEEGPNAAEKFLHDVCITEGIMNNDGGRIPRAALAAMKQPGGKER